MIFFVVYIVIRTKYETTNITVPRHSGLILGANEKTIYNDWGLKWLVVKRCIQDEVRIANECF